jgi:hypothetical protein
MTELNRLSFQTKLSSFGASKLEKLYFEGARGNLGPFWKLWTTFNMAAAYAIQPRRPDQIVFDSTFDSTI